MRGKKEAKSTAGDGPPRIPRGLKGILRISEKKFPKKTFASTPISKFSPLVRNISDKKKTSDLQYRPRSYQRRGSDQLTATPHRRKGRQATSTLSASASDTLFNAHSFNIFFFFTTVSLARVLFISSIKQQRTQCCFVARIGCVAVCSWAELRRGWVGLFTLLPQGGQHDFVCSPGNRSVDDREIRFGTIRHDRDLSD